eukprot:4736134-Karenia_brevis.AAC.1
MMSGKLAEVGLHMLGEKKIDQGVIDEVAHNVALWFWGDVPVLGPDHFEKALEKVQDTGVGMDGIPYSALRA